VEMGKEAVLSAKQSGQLAQSVKKQIERKK
jgi:hypothetical protein